MSIGLEEPISASIPGSLLARRLAWVLLAALMAASVVLIWTWGQGLTLIDDEWGYALRTATQSAPTYLFSPPTGKHLIAVPILFYRAAFGAFGISSDTPYQVAHLVLLVLCAGLFFLLARRRVGDLLAVLATGVLLFLGPAREVMATPLRVPSLISTAAGLGMLLMFERRDRLGDVAACVLLAISLASLSTGYAFAAAAAVLVLARPSPERWRRSWIFLVPVVLYVIWWLLEFDIGPNAHPLGSTILGLPVYLGKSLGVTVLTITGLVNTGSTGQLILPVALYWIIGAILVGLLAWALVARIRRPEPLSPFLVAMAAALVIYWTATAFAPGPERVPWGSRYLYLDAVLFGLFLCELARGLDVPRRLTRVGWAIAAVAFAIAIVGGARELHNGSRLLVEDSDYIRAGLTSLQMAGDNASPAFRLETTLATVTPKQTGLLGEKREDNGVLLGGLTAAGFFSVIDRYGSPAYSPVEVSTRPPGVRHAADVVLVRAMGLRVVQASRVLELAARPSPKPLAPAADAWEPAGPGCVKLPAAAGATTGVVSLGTQGASIEAGRGSPVSVSLGRFGDGTTVPVGTVPAGRSAYIRIPPDAPGERSTIEWRLGLGGAAGATVCGLGSQVSG